jgi:hypothetical protein
MDYTIVSYNCYGSQNTDGSPLYKIDAAVSAKGELPEAGVFVYNIVRKERIDKDTFARVATPIDVQTLKFSRHQAVHAEQSQYISSTVSLTYPTLDIAIQAKATLTERINDLAKGWVDYNAAFQSSDTSMVFPNGSETVADNLKTAYTTARDDHAAANTALAQALLTVDGAVKDMSYAQKLVDAWYYSVVFLKKESHSGNDIGFITLLNTYHNSKLIPHLTSEDVDEGDAAALWTSGEGTVTGDIETYRAYCRAQLDTWRAQLHVFKEDYATAVEERIAAEQNLKASEKEEAKAKADIIAVCPGFDFSTI